ncbi:MAG: sigma-70 family RNA polymerase sigma factor [Ruminococcaceae bacterium]|nr:sigma-70 family RNA polymerase sigma factor [Oscillospiraceae bacterium]
MPMRHMKVRSKLSNICLDVIRNSQSNSEERGAPEMEKKTDSSAQDVLFKQYVQTRNPKLRNQIIEKYLYIPEIITKRYVGKGVEYDDLYQVACVGLIHAVERFDPDKGIKFVSFATPTVLGEVRRYFRDKGFLIKLPRKIYEVFQKANRIRLAREQYDGYIPTTDEIANALNVSTGEVEQSLEYPHVVAPQSLEATLYADESIALSQVIGVEEDSFLMIETQEFLCASLRSLDPKEKTLLVERFYKNRTQKEIAAQWGVSQMYISRMERKMLGKLKQLYEQ